MIGELLQTGYTYNQGRQLINSALSGDVIFNNLSANTFNGPISNIEVYYSSGVIDFNNGYLDNNNGTITLYQDKVALFNNSNFTGNTKAYTITGGTTGTQFPPLQNNKTNYIYVKYNNGSPVYDITIDQSIITDSDSILYLTVYRDNNILHVVDYRKIALGLSNKLNQRLNKTQNFIRESGLIISEFGARNINVTPGVVWASSNRIFLSGVSSTADTVDFWFHSAGTYVHSATTQWINNLYDDGTNLQSLSASYYNVNWIFRGVENRKQIFIVLGNSNVSSIPLNGFSLPTLPDVVVSNAMLIGAVAFQNGSSVATSIDSAFEINFVQSPISSHKNLADLQGGISPTELYHLNKNEHDNIALTNRDTIFGNLTSTGNSIANNFTASSIFIGSNNIINIIPNITGSGTNNFLTRWTPNGTTLGNSSIRDDGNNMSIGLSIDSSYKLLISSTATTGGIKLINYSGISASIFQSKNYGLNGFGGIFSSENAISNVGIVGLGGISSNPLLSGKSIGGFFKASATTNISEGIYAEATDPNNTSPNIGGHFKVSNSGSGGKFVLQLEDGSDNTGKSLVSLDAFGHIGFGATSMAGVSSIQQGLNITTGGTSTNPIINLSPSINLTSITVSTITASTYYSGSTLLDQILGSVQQKPSAYINLTNGSNVTWYLSASTNANLTATNITNNLIVCGMTNGDYGTLKIKQGQSGSTINLPINSYVANGGGGAIYLTSNLNAIDILSFTYDGSNFYWNIGYDYN